MTPQTLRQEKIIKDIQIWDIRKYLTIFHIQLYYTVMSNPHTFVPQDIVQITESTGLLIQFVEEFWHLFPLDMNLCAD